MKDFIMTWFEVWTGLCVIATCARILGALRRVPEAMDALKTIADMCRGPKTITLSPEVMEALRGMKGR